MVKTKFKTTLQNPPNKASSETVPSRAPQLTSSGALCEGRQFSATFQTLARRIHVGQVCFGGQVTDLLQRMVASIARKQKIIKQ
jgi:hypothetical protein